MTHNHEHCCHHEFKYCSQCDTVYCKKCNREWIRKYDYSFTYTSPGTTVWNTANALNNITSHACEESNDESSIQK